MTRSPRSSGEDRRPVPLAPTVERRLTLAVLAVQAVGGGLTTIYFTFLLPPSLPPTAAVTPVGVALPWVLAGLLAVMGSLWNAYRERPLRRYQQTLQADQPAATDLRADALRVVLQMPLRVSLTVWAVWVALGVLIAVLRTTTWAGGLHAFAGTGLVAGGSAAVLTYFVLEQLWRPWLRQLFPGLATADMQGTFRLRVGPRLLLVLWFGTLLPLSLLALLSFAKAQHLLTAADPDAVITSLLALTVFIVALGLGLAAALAAVVSGSIVRPVAQLRAALGRVQSGDFAVRVAVDSHDELGVVSERFNQMALGLAERERIRETFGRFVSPDVAASVLEQEAGQLGGTTLEVSVLFADIRNFTRLSEQLATAPQALVALLNAYFTAMLAVIERHKGMVNKFGGDAILAVFGAPVPQPDHAARAVQAALAMRAALTTFNTQQQAAGAPELHIGIGINTGHVVAGTVGSPHRMEYTVIGDEVNLAQRIEDYTKRVGTDLLVSATTYAGTRHIVDAEPLPPIQVKGKDQVVQVYKVHAARDVTRPAATPSPGQS